MDHQSQIWLRKKVRQQDKDRFLSVAFLPHHCRLAVLAILAFNAEVAQIRETTTEPLIAAMRLQWWRDVLAHENCVDNTNPIVTVLRSPEVWSSALQDYLLNIIDARYEDIDFKPFENSEDVHEWVERVTQPLGVALIHAIDSKVSHSPTAICYAMQAHGHLGVLRMTHDAMQNHKKVWAPDLSDKEKRYTISLSVFERAQYLLGKAVAGQGEVPSQLFPLMLHARLAQQYSDVLIANNHEILDPRFYGPPRITLPMIWSVYRRKI